MPDLLADKWNAECAALCSTLMFLTMFSMGMTELSGFVGRAKFYATHVQIDELKNTSNDARRAALLKVFEEITNITVPTESFVLGSSQLGEAKLGGERPVPTESAVWGVSKWGECSGQLPTIFMKQ